MADKEAAKKAKKDGLDAFKAKDFDKAIEHYTKAIELDPKDVGYIKPICKYFDQISYLPRRVLYLTAPTSS